MPYKKLFTMTKKLFFSVLTLLSVFTLALTSCSNDPDEPSQGSISITNAEFGHDNEKTAIIGRDLHLEADIRSDARIKAIRVALIKDDNNKMEHTYTDSKYVGVLNTTFHEHLSLPETLAEGDYQCIITVTDANDRTAFVNENITLKKASIDANQPKINNLLSNTLEASANGQITLSANIETSSSIKEIEVEFHGDAEYPLEIADYNGQSGQITFNKTLTIPSECKPGTYHIHFTVTDDQGRSTTEEIEDFVIK